MSRDELHDWNHLIEDNTLSIDERLKIARSIYDTAYERGKASAERPYGEWIENTRYKRKGKKFLDCSRCHYGENGDIICEISKVPNYCPNCGAIMSANGRQVIGKL